MRIHLVSMAIVALASGVPSVARAQGEPDDRASSSHVLERGGFSPHVVSDLRVAMLVRSNSGYFSQASTFGFPIPTTALGFTLGVGVELLPRLSLVATGSYFGQGATREQYAKLMLTSESLGLDARYAFLRWESAPVMGQIEARLGGGRYWMRETFTDPLLSSQSFVADGASLGFSAGLEASVHVSVFRTVVGYAYHYAPATIENRIGGAVHAGGHEISFGFGIRL